MAGTREECRERKRRHHRDIEENRCCRSAGEALHHIEHAAIERHQRDQKEIGKGDACQLDRQGALGGIVGEARRENAHGLRHEHDGKHQQHHLRGEQQRKNAIGEQMRGVLAALPAYMRIGRHERGVEGALGEDGSEMIGQP